jgi:hypothetical protein
MRWYAARRDLSAALLQLSRETKVNRMSLTGASQLSSSIKDMIEQAKARVAAAHQSVGGAVSNINDAARTAENVAKTINAEADALLADLGQLSNGGPPLDTPTPTPLPDLGPINANLTGEPKKNEGTL